MKVLEEFWYGNINPMERPFQSQRKFDKVFGLLTKNEEELLKNLNEQNKAYIEGFGYVAPAKTIIVDSDGDINKIIGTMEK